MGYILQRLAKPIFAEVFLWEEGSLEKQLYHHNY